jgi:hypothetical protein
MSKLQLTMARLFAAIVLGACAISAVAATPAIETVRFKNPDALVQAADIAAPQPAAPDAVTAANNYTFATNTSASLTDMSSGTTQLVAASADDTASAVTNIGFEFYLLGARYTTFSASSNGAIRLGGAVSASQYVLGTAGQTLLGCLVSDNIVSNTGRVHYKVTGSAPSRVLTVEFLNETIIYDGAGTSADGTCQVRLYENTGVVELVYGTMKRNAGTGFGGANNAQYIGFSTGNTANTFASVDTANTVSTTVLAANQFPLSSPMASLTSATQGSRRIYSFTPATPTAPTGLNYTGVSATAMTLNWTDSPDESVYAIYRSTDGVNYTFQTNLAQNTTSFSTSGLTPSTTYFWQVVAVSDGALSTALASSQATTAAGNIASTAAGGLWSANATWVGGVVPTANDNVTIADGATVTIDTAAVALSVTVGTGGATANLTFEATTARTLTVGTFVTNNINGVLNSNIAGTQTGHVLSVGTDLTNIGVLDFSTNADTAAAGITFTGAANNTFGGTGAVTDVRTITVNKGTSNANIIELNTSNFSVRGVTTDTVAGGWLVLTNGTMKVSGTFAGTSRVYGAAAYTIGATTGFWLNNPNYVVAGQNGSPVNNGLLRVSSGTYNIGTAAGNSMTGGAGAVFTIEGGTINISGRLSPASAVTYNQSGGTLNVSTVGNAASTGSFSLVSGSTFNMTAGTINVVQASTGATPIDFINSSTILTAFTGTLQLGTAATATNFNFRIRGNIPNLVIDNTTTNKQATATAQINLRGTTLINPGTTLTINGFVCLVIGPTFTNNGTLTGTTANTRFYFLGGSGPSTYTGTGVVTAPLTQWEVDNVAGVTIAPTVNQIVSSRYNNFSGGLTGSARLTLGNGGATSAVVQLGVTGVTNPVGGFDVPPVFNPGTGGVILIYAPEISGRTTGNEMPPSRTLTTLNVINPNPVTIAGGNVEVNGAGAGAIALSGGRVITGANVLYFNSAAGTVTRTTGYVDGNFRKSFSAAGAKTFEVGTANGYSPVDFNVTAGTFPTDVTAKAIEGAAPGFVPASQALLRYWTLTATGITSDVAFTYLAGDVPGTVVEAGMHVYRNDGGTFTDLAGTITTATKTATVFGVTQFSDWTLGGQAGQLTITPTSVPFGNQAVNTTSAPQTVTLGNSGNATLNVTALDAASAPFALSGGTCSAVPITITAGSSCTLTYTFAPTVPGLANQTLAVTADQPGSGTIALSGTGTQGQLTIVPTSVPFGSQLVGTASSPQTVTLGNSGNASLDVTTLDAAAAPFARTGGTCSAVPITIAAGTSCTLDYTFTPSATGAANQTLTVTANAPGSGTIALSGTGVQGHLTITPTSVPFGNQQVGVASGPQTVTLGNDGSASLDVTTLTAAAAPFALSGGTCSGVPITIAAGTSCTLQYTFTPSATGAANQTLTVTANQPGSGTIALSGTGVQGNLTVAPTTRDFGTVPTGSTTTFATVTLGNDGTGSLSITALTLAAAPFTRTTDGTCGNSLPITINAGESCTVSYTFSPTSTGLQSQVFNITTTATGTKSYTLQGTGAFVDAIFSDSFE